MYQILEAASVLRNLLLTVSEKELSEAFQRIATKANDSEFASTHEPYSGICDAILAAQAQMNLPRGNSEE